MPYVKCRWILHDYELKFKSRIQASKFFFLSKKKNTSIANKLISTECVTNQKLAFGSLMLELNSVGSAKQLTHEDLDFALLEALAS